MGLVCSLLAVKDGLGTVLSSFGASRNGFRAPKLTLLLSKKMVLLLGISTFSKNNVCDPMMVLEAFWASIGFLLGALGGLLGALWGL